MRLQTGDIVFVPPRLLRVRIVGERPSLARVYDVTFVQDSYPAFPEGVLGAVAFGLGQVGAAHQRLGEVEPHAPPAREARHALARLVAADVEAAEEIAEDLLALAGRRVAELGGTVTGLVIGAGQTLVSRRRLDPRHGRQGTADVHDGRQAAGDGAPAESEEATWQDVMAVDTLGLEVGYRLIALVDNKQDGDLLKRIKAIRKKFAQEIGFLPPAVHLRDNLELRPSAYRITLRGVVVGEGEVFDRVRARWSGHRIEGDASIRVSRHLNVLAAHDIADEVEHAMLGPTMPSGDPVKS